MVSSRGSAHSCARVLVYNICGYAVAFLDRQLNSCALNRMGADGGEFDPANLEIRRLCLQPHMHVGNWWGPERA